MNESEITTTRMITMLTLENKTTKFLECLQNLREDRIGPQGNIVQISEVYTQIYPFIQADSSKTILRILDNYNLQKYIKKSESLQLKFSMVLLTMSTVIKIAPFTILVLFPIIS